VIRQWGGLDWRWVGGLERHQSYSARGNNACFAKPIVGKSLPGASVPFLLGGFDQKCFGKLTTVIVAWKASRFQLLPTVMTSFVASRLPSKEIANG
jgi:hypothetical protein